MKRWLSDGVLRAVLRNAGFLGSAKVVAAPLGLLAMACAGRELAPAAFGLLIIIHTYATGAGALAKFQTWHLIIRYGAPALARGDLLPARDAIRFAFGLDLASGLLGMVGAMAVLPLVAGRLGLAGSGLALALFYCTLVPTMTAATPTGVLRLLDRFDLIGMQQLITPVLRATGALLCVVGRLGFAGFVVTWYVADLAGDLVAWGLAARETRRRDLADALRPGLFAVARRLPGSWGFAWTTNLGHSVYAAWGPLSNLVVAAVLGPVAAGLYKIASTLLDAAAKPADLLARGFYPEVMRLDPAAVAPWRLALRMAVLAGLVGLGLLLLVLVGGRPVIALVFGRRYLPSFPLLQLMVWSLAVSMAAFPLESLLYMVGRQRAYLMAQLLGTAAYLLALAGLAQLRGLQGAGEAYLLGTLLTTALLLAPVLASFRQRARYAVASA